MKPLLTILSFIVGLLPFLAAANPPVWMIELEKSSISFEYVEAGKLKTGAFRAFEASIAFDPDVPEETTASFYVETASINLNDAMREGVLVTVPWFDSERFPKARFSLTGLRPISEGKYLADGILRIKATELPVQSMVSLLIEGRSVRATGRVEIDRKDFRLRDALLESVVSIGEKVTIDFDLLGSVELK